MSEVLIALAERVEAAGDLTCPLCGDEGFDVPGISMHWFKWCEVNTIVGFAHSNSDVAAALRAIAARTS